MGGASKRLPLPAPTDPSTLSSVDNDTTLTDDLGTDVSRRTDKTSYSIPEDGTPITINTAKKELGSHRKYPSQTSLLIEYFEGGKEDSGNPKSRPSVRVRVTPSSHRKNKSSSGEHVKITQKSRNPRKPSYTQRISLSGNSPGLPGVQTTEASYSDDSNVSSRPPVEVEVLQPGSELSSFRGRVIPLASDISSMPPDSMLEGSPVIRSPRRPRSRSLERTVQVDETQETLKAPTRQRSRSLSKERITQRVMEKLGQKPAEKTTPSKGKDAKSSREELTPSRRSRQRTSRSSREEDAGAMSGTDSSLLSSNVHRRSGDAHSVRSAVSGTSSINNPKLLATVEDAIKRLILPELNALKEEQRTQKNRNKFERLSRDSIDVDYASSREQSRRRVSKVSSAPDVARTKPKVVLNRDGDDPGTVLSGGSSHKGRRSSRGSVSDRSYAESARSEDKVRRKKSKDKSGSSSKDAAMLVGAGLTTAALKRHESRESARESRHHSRSRRSRSASISESIEDDQHMTVPPMPLLPSELQSDVTRDSIRSAETETKERPGTSSSRSSRGTGVETPLQEVQRGSFQVVSPGSRTPTRTPIALQRGLGTPLSNRSQDHLSLSGQKSDRSIRSRGTSAAALDAAAAAKARALESNEPPVSQYEIDQPTPTRALSPIQSEASYREEVHQAHGVRSPHSAASLSSAGRIAQRQGSSLSIRSFESSPSTKGARTRKRPQGVNLESPRSILGTPEAAKEAERFFAENHETNEMYRREIEATSQDNTPTDHRLTTYTDDTDGPIIDRDSKGSLGQDIRKVGSNPEYVHTPLAVESAVASLHEPSNISVRSSVSSPVKKGMMAPPSPQYTPDRGLKANDSQERWEALRGQAATLADRTRNGNGPESPRQSIAKSVEEPFEMQANAFPMGSDMPEIGYGIDDDSDVTTNPYHDEDEMSERSIDHTPLYSKTGVHGMGSAASLETAPVMVSEEDPAALEAHYHQPSVEEDNYEQDYEHLQSPYLPKKATTPVRSDGIWKDEGYSSAHHGGITPSKYLDDDAAAGFGASVFSGDIHTRHLSHGSDSLFAAGKGLDHIDSKGVVALMDHLTVRDAQRNARDTEILVTLVRSAAEMRNSFEEMKQFIRTQDSMILNTTDKRLDLTEQRVIGGPRPLPGSSSFKAGLRSSTDDIEVEQKRKNVFKRALKGLSLKGDSDIKKIEQMLMQLLGEVEGLKRAQALSLQQQTNRSNSLTSYEGLRTSGDPGYEPEGRADTATSPNQSGYLSNPSSRRIQDMHSGYDVHQPHRISTVEEDDEEYAEDAYGNQYENTERMTTPTQEARRNNSTSQETPPQASKAFRESNSMETTPKRKHKSNTSSIFGIPKISRWSKTTASTDPQSMPRNSGSSEIKRPYSDASRSGSQINMYYDEPYAVQDDDRLRSSTSLSQQQAPSIRSSRSSTSMRPASPLIPQDDPEPSIDDPKYQAHRNSLNLQHPQPRPGPTHRHRSHLESQAQIFEPVGSPDYDQWGSNPSLARNRLSGGHASQGAGNLTPISSNGEYSPVSASGQQAAPPRPPKIPEDGPLVPQQPLAGHGQTRQMYSSPDAYGGPGGLTPLAPIQEVRYSLETDTGHHYSPTPSPRPSRNQNLRPDSMSSPQRKITGPRPMGSRSPSVQSVNGGLNNSGTVVKRKPVPSDHDDLRSYHSSDSEMF